MTLLHHAEHLADIHGKQVRRYQAPMLVDGQTVWRRFEEFNTGEPVVPSLADDYFEDFLATSARWRGLIGHAHRCWSRLGPWSALLSAGSSRALAATIEPRVNNDATAPVQHHIQDAFSGEVPGGSC